MSTMAWSQQTLPMHEPPPAYVDVKSQQLPSLSEQLVHLKPSSMPSRMDARQMLSQPKEGFLGPFAGIPSYLMPRQLSTSNGETLKKKLFPHVQEHKDFTSYPQQPKRTATKEPWPKVITLSSAKKCPTQTKSQNPNSGSVRLQKSYPKNKGVTHTEQPPKTTESFESIRCKMRESLAASLALVYNDDIKREVEVKNCNPNVDKKNAENGKLSSVRTISSAPLDGLEHSPKTYEGHDVRKDENVVGSSTVSSAGQTATYDSEMLKCDEMQNEKCENFVQDDLLVQNGLNWTEECEVQENPEANISKSTSDFVSEGFSGNPRTLATKIEAELFKLFAGVNKKYREKARSLLFNLRDQNNPELRRRVVSGEILPERLCSMTTEELASKELSQWRIAKAEERAQMVILPDSEVDLKRLVKKTHKGEIQVEVDQDDNVFVEVEVGANSLPQNGTRKRKGDLKPQLKSNVKVKKSGLKSHETGSETRLVLPDKTDLGEDTLTSLLQDSTDFMQDVMVGEFRDAESLPPVPSLDEFMRDLDSRPPFGNLSEEDTQEAATSDERKSRSSGTNVDTETKSPKSKLDAAATTIVSKSIDFQDNCESGSVNANTNTLTEADPATISVNPTYKNTKHAVTLVESEASATPTRKTPKADNHVWDGLVQLNITSLVTVLGFYKSGEQTPVNIWPSFLEIKGRVRVDAFEKFLRELNLSRSRGIMIMEFAWKQNSPESGRLKLRETIESYIADERVGFAEPVPGVELYFCPPHPTTSRVLLENLPKQYGGGDDVLIGVVIWRRPTPSSASTKPPPPPLRSGPKFGSQEQRKGLSSNADVASIISLPAAADDDIPPGFGPPASRADEDLPEFDFVQGKKQAQASGFAPPAVRPLPAHSVSVEHIRQMIQRYGQDESANRSQTGIEPWNDEEDDDIPEWRPNQRQPQQNPQNRSLYHRDNISGQHVQHPTRPPAASFFPFSRPESGRWQGPPAPGPRRYDGPSRQEHQGPGGGFMYDRNGRR